MPIRVNTVEDVDLMSDEESRRAVISGFSKVRVNKAIEQGQDYIHAKRANFTTWLEDKEKTKQGRR